MPPRLTRIWAKLRMARHRIPRLRMMGMHPKMNRFSLVLNLVKATLVPRLKQNPVWNLMTFPRLSIIFRMSCLSLAGNQVPNLAKVPPIPRPSLIREEIAMSGFSLVKMTIRPMTNSESVQDAEAGAPPARRRRSTRKKVSEAEPKSDASDAEASDEEETNTGQSQKLRMPGRRRQRVVSIDAERTVQTDTDRLRSDLLDLVESLKSKKILTGTIQGVGAAGNNPEMSYAVIYHGDFKVIIPVLEAIEEPEDYRGQPRGDVLHYLLNKRLGAEVDYIVKGRRPGKQCSGCQPSGGYGTQAAGVLFPYRPGRQLSDL